jgi:Tfp pilus assembly protein PilF
MMNREPGIGTVQLLRVACLLIAVNMLSAGCSGPPAEVGISEEAMKHNILGPAYLSQQQWSKAQEAFRLAIAASPGDKVPLNNLAVALLQEGKIDEAEPLLLQALALDADFPYTRYNLGLVEKSRGNFEKAVLHFENVGTVDPADLLTQYNLGFLYGRTERVDAARQAFENALKRNPQHVSTLYGLGRLLLRAGEIEEGTRLVTLSQEIRINSGLDDAVGSQYGEQGPYALGYDYPGDVLAAPQAIEVSFTPAGSSTLDKPLYSAVAYLFGADAPVTMPAGDDSEMRALAAGDIDDDGTLELLTLQSGPGNALSLGVLRATSDGSHTWGAPEAVCADCTLSPETAVVDADLTLVDQDHDGDLDIFWCWSLTGTGAGCRIAVNDGAGNFSLAATPLEVAPPQTTGGPVSVTFLDFDNDRDIDLLAILSAELHLLSNRRNSAFLDVSTTAGLDAVNGTVAAVSVADLNKDGEMDLIVSGAFGTGLLLNDRGEYQAALPLATDGQGETGLLVLDYDNDGFLDLALSSTAAVPSLLRNLGNSRWAEPTGLFDAATPTAGSRLIATLDSDGDGDLDLLSLDDQGSLTLLDNEGGNTNNWIDVKGNGIGDNTHGIGAKVEVLAGALRQKFEFTRPVPLHVGLGSRSAVEAVRILWPGGVLQDEINQSARAMLEIEQLDRKGTSCPLLYAWSPDGWRFVTDFLGGTAIGYQHAPGVLSIPDTDEYIKIEGGIHADADGQLRLRMNNQLEEVIWFDKAELVVVDHPLGTDIYPNERLMPGPPFPAFKLFASSEIRPLTSVKGIDDGRDWTAAMQTLDSVYIDGFELLPFKGYAREHTLELDLGPFTRTGRTVLLLDGWIDYADSSSNIAADQAGAALLPPRLLIADSRGGWREVEHLMGFPAGLPKTMAIDLSGLFPGDDHRIRLTTTMRIYWDRARLMLGGDDTQLEITRLQPLSATLRHGGYPRPLARPDSRHPYRYDPTRIDHQVGWKAHVGAYTAFGDVGGLLGDIDDRFVTTRSGDEIELRFSAPPPVAEGMTRSYLLFADGFGKDMDPNSEAANTVGPIPFHGMPVYPYDEAVLPPAGTAPDQPSRLVLPSRRGWPGAPPLELVAKGQES